MGGPGMRLGLQRFAQNAPLPAQPSISNISVPLVTEDTFIVTATVNPAGTPLVPFLHYGLTAGYGLELPAIEGMITETGTATFIVIGLTDNTTYYYKIVAGETESAQATQVTLLNQKILLERNADIVEIGFYPAISTASTNLSAGSPPLRYFINKNNLGRVRQSGIITKISFYKTLTTSTPTVFYVQIVRLDGSTYDRIAQVDISSLIPTEAGTVIIDLPTPLNCLEGDFIVFGGQFYFGLTGVAGYTANSLRYTTNETPSETDFAWDSKSALGYTLPFKAYGQAPLLAAIGDSIIAGHPAHYSYIEGSLVSALESSVNYQLRQIDANYIGQNMGIGSQTTTQIAARFAADVTALKPRLAIIQGGVNDIAAGAITKATFLANYTTMLNACVAASIVPVICKMIPWTAGTTAQMRIRDEWNADLAVLVATYTGAICIDFDSTLGVFDATGDEGNLWNIKTEYNADNVHLNVAGYTTMAAKIDEEIKKVYRFV